MKSPNGEPLPGMGICVQQPPASLECQSLAFLTTPSDTRSQVEAPKMYSQVQVPHIFAGFKNLQVTNPLEPNPPQIWLALGPLLGFSFALPWVKTFSPSWARGSVAFDAPSVSFWNEREAAWAFFHGRRPDALRRKPKNEPTKGRVPLFFQCPSSKMVLGLGVGVKENQGETTLFFCGRVPRF